MKIAVGDKIREVRERRKLTMKEVALAAGVSESLISQIERNRVSPALDTLGMLCEVLDLDLEYLFSGYKRTKSVHVVHPEDRERFEMKGVRYEKLARTANPGGTPALESYYLEIPPGGEKGNTEYGHVGQELGIVVEGTGELVYGKEVLGLKAGDSLSFGSDIPHVLRNTGPSALKAFLIITPPKDFPSN